MGMIQWKYGSKLPEQVGKGVAFFRRASFASQYVGRTDDTEKFDKETI